MDGCISMMHDALHDAGPKQMYNNKPTTQTNCQASKRHIPQ
jgi:hypothetical protein